MRHVSLVVVVIAALAGCSPQEPASSPSSTLAAAYRAQIDEFLTNGNPSDLQRSILADYWVTDAEMTEAQDAMRQCLAAADPPLTVEFKPDGQYHITGVDDYTAQYGALGEQKFDQAEGKCSTATIDRITFLYTEPRRNPEGLTYVQLVRRCFEEHGVPDGDDLSDEALLDMITGPNYTASMPEGQQCQIDPYGS